MQKSIFVVLVIVALAGLSCGKKTLEGAWRCERIFEPPRPPYATEITVDVCPPDVDRSTHPECIKKPRSGCPVGPMFSFVTDPQDSNKLEGKGGFGDDPKGFRITLDPSSNPSRFVMAAGPRQNEMYYGIYKLDGDHLTLKMKILPERPAPTEFGLDPDPVTVQVELLRCGDGLYCDKAK